MQCIYKWAIDPLNWGNLPLHQLNQKYGTIIDNENIAKEIKGQMMEKARGSFLKAKDVVDIVASLGMQVIFVCKGITRASISIKTGYCCWLEKLGWTYRKLRNGMDTRG